MPKTLPRDRRLLQALSEANLPAEFRYRVFLQGIRLDLYCPEARLAVQLEGPRRSPRTQLTEDSVRELGDLGILLLRLPESRIDTHLREVVATLRKLCEERTGRRDR